MSAVEWTIAELLQLSGGYWSTCALHAGVKLDIFTPLTGSVLTAAEVADLCNTEQRATSLLLDALASLGLLEKNGKTYTATLFSAEHLATSSPGYLGHIIMHHHHLMSGWEKLGEAVTSGVPVRGSVSHGDDEIVRESFLMGMFNLASLLAPRIAQSINLSGCHRLLDLGGGPGTYAIHFCRANPELSAVVYDLPTTRTFAEKTIARFDLADSITFTSGDYHFDPVPGGFDVAWLSHILHSDGTEACVALLRRAVAAIKTGGILMVQEFIMNNDKDGPLFPALFSLNMLIGTDAGQAYSEYEVQNMMEQAGLSEVTRIQLHLPNGAGILKGRKA
jgi:hypothetical protein